MSQLFSEIVEKICSAFKRLSLSKSFFQFIPIFFSCFKEKENY